MLQKLYPYHTLIVAIALLITVITLWLPFGFSITCVADGWKMQDQAAEGVLIRWDDVRPVVPVPWAIAHVLSPDSFVGTNLVLAALLLGKGFITYLLISRLVPRAEALAFAAAVLFIVYPADTAVFNLGALSIHFIQFFLLAAVWLLIVYWQRPSVWLLPVMGLALLISLSYEPAYLLAALTPLLLIWLERRLTRRVIRVSVLWYIVPFLYGLRVIGYWIARRSSRGYQKDLLHTTDVDWLNNIWFPYRWHFYEGWKTGFQQMRSVGGQLSLHDPSGVLDSNVSYLLWSGLVIVAAAPVIMLLLEKSTAQMVLRPVRDYFLLVAAGLAIVLIGYAPYIPTDLRGTSDRTFFYSSFGAALAVSTLWFIICRLVFKKHLLLPYASIILLIAAGALFQLYWHNLYFGNSKNQRVVLAGIVEKVPAYTPGTALVLVDESPDFYASGAFGNNYSTFRRAVRFIYGDQGLRVFMCTPKSEVFNLDATCDFTGSDQLAVSIESGSQRKINYDTLILLTLSPERKIELVEQIPDRADYDPYPHILSDHELPRRARANLAEQLK